MAGPVPGSTPKKAPMPVPRRIGPNERLEVLPRREQVGHLRGEHLALGLLAEVADDLAEREHADRDHDEADAVGQFVEAEA